MVLDEKTRQQLKEMGALPKTLLDPFESNQDGDLDQNDEESEVDESEVFFVCRPIDEEFITNSADSHHLEEALPKLPPFLAQNLSAMKKKNKVDSNISELIKPKGAPKN
jgi:hypothetical protein